MKKPLDELRDLRAANEHCPILCAGDIFHRWNSSPELINFAIDNMPGGVFCIPGQHDLPLHNYKDIEKSAYKTLALSRATHDRNTSQELIHFYDEHNTIVVDFFPFGFKIKPLKERESNAIHVAVVHEYKWIAGHNYTSAPTENLLRLKSKNIKNNRHFGYDVIVYGDNHKGFLTQIGKTTIFNCGSLMRRNSDQAKYQTQVGLLYSDGSVEPHYLKMRNEKHILAISKNAHEDSLNMKEFIEELEKLGDTDLDFNDAMNNYLKKNKIKMPIANIILKAMNS
jgi:DNA repair exonuclease SbcCD nuclease subunit